MNTENKKDIPIKIETIIKIPKEYIVSAEKRGAICDLETEKCYVPENVFISQFNQFIPLTIQLIPSSNWYNNVRSEYANDWDYIKRLSYKKANYRCEICNSVGDKHPVECHEIWDFDIDSKTQKLIGLISLCPTCHKVKHIGLAFTNGEEDIAIKQLQEVNSWTKVDACKYIEESFLIFEELSKIKWKLDLSLIESVLKSKCLP